MIPIAPIDPLELQLITSNDELKRLSFTGGGINVYGKISGRWKNSKCPTIIESEVWRDLGLSGQKQELAQNKQEIGACSNSIKQVSAEIVAKAASTESSGAAPVDSCGCNRS